MPATFLDIFFFLPFYAFTSNFDRNRFAVLMRVCVCVWVSVVPSSTGGRWNGWKSFKIISPEKGMWMIFCVTGLDNWERFSRKTLKAAHVFGNFWFNIRRTASVAFSSYIDGNITIFVNTRFLRDSRSRGTFYWLINVIRIYSKSNKKFQGTNELRNCRTIMSVPVGRMKIL